LAYLKFRHNVNDVFEFISVPYTIADLQVPELFRINLVGRNGAMWKTCFSAPQNAKKISWNI